MLSDGTMMRPPVKVENTFLQRKYDLSKYQKPELTWSFYDSYHASKPVALARANGETSIENHRLDQYLTLAVKRPEVPRVELYPFPFNELIPLQSLDGRWEDPVIVKEILGVPVAERIGHTTDWEEATCFVLAAMRIRCDLFDVLEASHDRAIGYISNHSWIYKAARIIGSYSSGNSKEAGSVTSSSVRRRSSAVSLASTPSKPLTLSVLTPTSPTGHSSLAADPSPTPLNASALSPQQLILSPTASPTSSRLQSMLQSSLPKRDLLRIQRLNNDIETLKVKSISRITEKWLRMFVVILD